MFWRAARYRAIGPVAAVVCLAACGRGSSSPPDTVTGRERLGWDQAAADADELAQLSYAVYVDGGMKLSLSGVTCEQTPGPSGFPCAAPLPDLSPGTHTLELVATVRTGGTEVESARSTPLSVTMAGSPAPRTTSGGESTPAAALAPRAASGSASDRAAGSALPALSHASSPPILVTTRDGARLAVETWAANLNAPSAMAFAPDGRLLIAERDTHIRVVSRQDRDTGPALTARDVADGSETASFVDLALHPAFHTNRFVYVLALVRKPGSAPAYRLARFRELNGALAERLVLLDEVPAGSSGEGATVRIGPDRRLYLAVEDLSPASVAQDLASPNGKILRLNEDGTTPRDNPWSSRVLSYGHAQPGGLAWHPVTGELWETERRPDGRDELNLITARGDYGWPDRGRQAASVARGMVRVPLDPFVDPGGATFYAGRLIPEFRHDLFFVSRGSGSLIRVRFDAANPRRVAATERLLDNRFGRLGNVVAGPDGALYVFTTNRAAGGRARPGDDRVLRIGPEPRGE